MIQVSFIGGDTLEEKTFIEVAKIVIPGVIAYLVGRWQTLRSHRIEIAKDRLYKAYLPMLMVVESRINEEITLEIAKEIHDKLDEIIKNNYELIKGDLIKGFRKFTTKFDAYYASNNAVEELYLIIDIEFERLRKEIGLPYKPFKERLFVHHFPKGKRKLYIELAGYAVDAILIAIGSFTLVLATTFIIEFIKRLIT